MSDQSPTAKHHLIRPCSEFQTHKDHHCRFCGQSACKTRCKCISMTTGGMTVFVTYEMHMSVSENTTVMCQNVNRRGLKYADSDT